MIVLAIDTSGMTASAAVIAPDGAGVAASDQPRAHGAVLPALIQRAAADAGVRLDDVTNVAVARGPGLFTGMRVGLVAAEVFAIVRGLPLAGVSTLDALARRVLDGQSPAGGFTVMVDARRREVFAARYGPDGKALGPPVTVSALAGDADADVFLDPAAARAYGLAGIVVSTDGLAREVGLIAAERWAGDGHPEPATALYLRQPDTSTPNPSRSVLGQQ